MAIVGVPGVSWTTAGGASSNGSGSGDGMRTASTFAAYEPDAVRTNVSSPTSTGARNSSLAEPPIAPDIADTITYGRPRRSNVRM